MLVFLRLLPAFTDRRDIGRFVRNTLGPRWFSPFRPKVQVLACDILRITDLDTRITEFHGLVQLHPADIGAGAIERLNEARLKGDTLEVREFYHRSNLRDRRSTAISYSDSPDSNERRKKDRRRSNLLIEQVSTSELPQD